MSIPEPVTSESGPAKISAVSLFLRLLGVLSVLAGILFLSAGQLDWLQAWVFVLIYGVYLLIYAMWMLRNDPGQLTERSQMKANVKGWDKVILSMYTGLLLAMLVLAGLDSGRFQWAPVLPVLQGLGWMGLVLAGILIGWTAYVNTYLSRYVRIQAERGQQVISKGPYRWVRHPMYAGIIVMMLGIPLALGSGWSLLPGVLIGILFVIRTALEDRTLQAELPGYREYAQRVRYRLVPWIW